LNIYKISFNVSVYSANRPGTICKHQNSH
jgi:hypothetical protein